MEYTVEFSKSKKSIHVDNIDMIEADTKYLNLYTEGRIYIYDGTIKQMLKDNPGTFIEVKRGKLVKQGLISHLEKDFSSNHFVVIKKHPIGYPKFKVSRRRLNDVLKKLPK